MPNYSHSQLSSFTKCKRQYQFHYIDRVDAKKRTIETFMGSRVHEVLERLYKDLQYQKLISEEDALVLYNKLWKKKWTDDIVVAKKDRNAEDYRKTGERCISDYYRAHHPFTQEGKILGIETEDRMRLDADRSYSIRIDRLVDKGGGIYEVHDYKTSGALPRQHTLDTDRQLAMYALWAFEEFKDAKAVRQVWHYLIFDKVMSVEHKPSELKDTRAHVMEIIHEIENAQSYPTHPSALCPYCDYQAICPEWAHAFELEEKPVNEYLNDDGLKLVNAYARTKNEFKLYETKAKEDLEKIEAALVAFAKTKSVSVVYGSDHKAKIKSSQNIKLPKKGTDARATLEETLKALKLYDQLTALDTNALKRLYKDMLDGNATETATDEKAKAEIAKFAEVETKESISLSLNKHPDQDEDEV